MNRKSQALVSQGSSGWRWAGAMFAAVAMGMVVAPASAGNPTMDLSVTPSAPNPAIYGSLATYTVKLTNTSNNTINNAGVTLQAPPGLGFVAPGPVCTVSTGALCNVAGPVTAYTASGFQLPRNGTLTMVVTYSLFAAPPPDSFVLTAVGTSSNNSS